MSEPSGPPIVPASPFAPERATQPRGCGRVALIGCGVLTLLLGIAMVVFLFKAHELLVWTLGQMETQLLAKPPEELTPADRERLSAAFESARAAIRANAFDPRALQALQGRLVRAGEKAQKGTSTREDLLELAAALEAVAKRPTPPPGTNPAPKTE